MTTTWLLSLFGREVLALTRANTAGDDVPVISASAGYFAVIDDIDDDEGIDLGFRGPTELAARAALRGAPRRASSPAP